MNTPPPSLSTELYVWRRNRAILTMALSPLAAAVGLVVSRIASGQGVPTLVPLLAVAGFLLTYAAYRFDPYPHVERARVEASAAGLRIGEQFIPRDAIREGLVVPGPRPGALLHRHLAPSMLLVAADVAEARALLRALGLDASQTAAHFYTLSRAKVGYRVGVPIVAGLLGLFLVCALALTLGANTGVAGLVVGGSWAAGCLATLVAFYTPTRLDVGADGLALRWLWMRRFVGYVEIATVEPYEKGSGKSHVGGVRITLRTGEDVEIHVTGGYGLGLDRTAVALVEERIREAREAFQAGDGGADASLLRRNGRQGDAWVTALRAIGAGANAGPRTAAIPRERLFRIVEDPTAAIADRAAAAVALGAELDEEGKSRIRFAAEATAAPRLRVAFERVADEQDAALIEATIVEIEHGDASATSRRSA